MIALWSDGPMEICGADLAAQVESLTYRSGVPFGPDRMAILGEISKRILGDPVLRSAPQYVALGYWLRRAAIQRLTETLDVGEVAGKVRTARGTALHLPPGNVDTIFVYSWAMSLLAGNTNLVRLPEIVKPETQRLVALLTSSLRDFCEGETQLFCQYPYGQDVEHAVSAYCDLRLVWGGDAKVNSVAKIPIRPDGLTIGFSDRKSLALIDTKTYRSAGFAERDALGERFFNDLFWFDQMGCGSPRLLVWVGDPGTDAGDFYQRVGRVAAGKSHRIETGITIGKLALGHDLLAEAVTDDLRSYGNVLQVNRAIDPIAALNRPHGGGFLCDWIVDRPDEIAPIATRTLQTVTHFGLRSEDLKALAQALRGRGGYRIVPIGQALKFEPTWDGVELLHHMTRSIVYREG